MLIQEILLCLIGIPGRFIIESIKGEFVFSTLAESFERPQTEQLLRLLQIGTLVKNCTNLIARLSDDSVELGKELKMKTGLYSDAFGRILEEIMDEYRQLVCDVELQLEGRQLPVSSLQLIFEPYYDLFFSLHATLCLYVSSSEYHGGSIINLVSNAQVRSIGITAKAYARIYSAVWAVMLHQICSWMEFGTLIDPHSEFFISEPLLETEVNLDWFSMQSIRREYVPHIFGFDLAGKILFIGKSVRVLLQKNSTTFLPEAEQNMIKECIAVLHEHESVDSVEIEVNKIHACILSSLWRKISETSDLKGCLEAMKSFYLLSHGEFYSIFISETSKLMSKPLHHSAEKDLNDGALLSAALQTGLEDDKNFSRFRIRIRPTGFDHVYSKLRKNEHLKSSVKDELKFCGNASLDKFSLRLCSALPFQTGAIWSSQPYSIESGFRTSFQFSATSNSCEGFAFVLQNLGPFVIGSAGTGLGYLKLPCLAVEFNFCRKKDENQIIRIRTGWNVPTTEDDSCTLCSWIVDQNDLTNGNLHSIVIEHKNGILTVEMESNSEMKTILSTSVDLFRLRPEAGRMWFGFTGTSASLNISPTQTEISEGIYIHALSFQDHPSGDAGAFDPWRRLGLECTLTSPLNLLFHSQSLCRYESLFRFLFTVKRVQYQLQDCWVVLKQSKLFWKNMKVERMLFSLRSRMQFLIDNLQFYLFVDVIEVQFSKLKTTLETVDNFELGKRAHDIFLSSLIKDCFLLSKPLMRCLDNIFSTSMQLCRLVNAFQDYLTKNDVASNELYQRLNTLDMEFKNNSSIMYTLLNTSVVSVTSPHVAQLLTRLDYNKHFSSSIAMKSILS